MKTPILMTFLLITSCVTTPPVQLSGAGLIQCKLVGHSKNLNLVGCEHQNPTNSPIDTDQLKLQVGEEQILNREEFIAAANNPRYGTSILAFASFFVAGSQSNESALAAAAVVSLLIIAKQISSPEELGTATDENRKTFYLDRRIVIPPQSSRRSVFAIKNSTPYHIQESFEVCQGASPTCQKVNIRDDLKARRRIKPGSN